jgi:predicted MFS family arabinose efflux permease
MSDRTSHPAPSTGRVLTIVGLVTFATSLFIRVVDPIIPEIAHDFTMDATTVALLSTAFALPYAIVQPALGAFADVFGKTRLMMLCLMVVVITSFVGAFAPNFSTLLASRVVAGAVAGGVFPVSLAIAADLVPVRDRQVAIGRLLAAAMMGNLLGSPSAGILADLIGWRSVFVGVGCLGLAALIVASIGFHGIGMGMGASTKADLASIPENYRTIYRNPLAKICYGAVLLEGIFIFGLFPFVATLLQADGEPRALIAGLVLAGFAAGGIVYALFVPRLLAHFGERRLMITGAIMMGFALIAVALHPSWQIEIIDFAVLGLGFYLLHGVIQIYATELAPAARGSAMALHSTFFFLGQALGPLVYRYGLAHAGLTASVAVSGMVAIGVGLVCSRRLRRRASST